MKIVLQRSRGASVIVDGQCVGEIAHGLVALIGIGHNDDDRIVDAMADKTLHLRIFNDDAGKMNRSVIDTQGDVLAVSQFTLLADCRKGRRPAFTNAAEPSTAKRLYERFVQRLRDAGLQAPTGIFAADMQVKLTNDGPVTIVLDSAEMAR